MKKYIVEDDYIDPIFRGKEQDSVCNSSRSKSNI